MASIDFVDYQTVIPASWLNEVDANTYSFYNIAWTVNASDSAAINGPKLAAIFATYKRIYIPAGIYYCDRELVGLADQEVWGDGRERSVLLFSGATRGISYSAANTSQRLNLHDFQIMGNATALDLLYLSGVKDVFINRMNIRTTSLSCIRLANEVFHLDVNDSELQSFTKAGLMCSGTVDSLIRFNNVRGTSNAGDITPEAGAGFIRVTTNLVSSVVRQSNINGGNVLDHFIVFEGASGGGLLEIDTCYSEFTSGACIKAKDTALLASLSVQNSNLTPNNNSFDSIDLNNGQAHNYVRIGNCRRPGSGGYLFHPGSTVDWEFIFGSRETGTQFVNGYNTFNNISKFGTAGIRHLTNIRTDGTATALQGFAIQNGVSFTEASNSATVNASQSGASVILRVAGTDRLTVNATGVAVSSAAWNNTHLIMGVYHLWVDGSGRLRIKSSAPASDTDGTVVGTQT